VGVLTCPLTSIERLHTGYLASPSRRIPRAPPVTIMPSRLGRR